MLASLLLIPFTAGVLADDARNLPAKPTAELRVHCELRDGTVVEGTFPKDAAALKLNTASGVMPIDLAKVERIEVADDRETTSVELAGGKRVTGFVESQALRVRTGKELVEVAFPALRKARLRRLWAAPAEMPVKTAGVKTSSVWSQSSPEGATDGEIGTSWNSGAWKGWIEVDLGKTEKLVEVRIPLDFFPAGNATHAVYVSDKPIGDERENARLLKSFSRRRRDYEFIFVACPAETRCRYVQVYCPESVSWFAVREVQVFGVR